MSYSYSYSWTTLQGLYLQLWRQFVYDVRFIVVVVSSFCRSVVVFAARSSILPCYSALVYSFECWRLLSLVWGPDRLETSSALRSSAAVFLHCGFPTCDCTGKTLVGFLRSCFVLRSYVHQTVPLYCEMSPLRSSHFGRFLLPCSFLRTRFYNVALLPYSLLPRLRHKLGIPRCRILVS